MRFAIKLYRLQAEQGRWLLHEHPNSATSWKMREMLQLCNDLEIQRAVAHIVRYGMQSSDELGADKVKKPTGFLNNSLMLKDQLSNKCLGGHGHIQLVGGRARASQVYPDKLYRAILRGIRAELVHSGIIPVTNNDMIAAVSTENNDTFEYMEEFIDDMNGQPMQSSLVREAHKGERPNSSSIKHTRRGQLRSV